MILKVSKVEKISYTKDSKDDSQKKDGYFYKMLSEEFISTKNEEKDTFSYERMEGS